MPFFSFSAAGIRAKCHLVSLDLQPLLWAQNQWKRYVFRNHLLLDPTVMTRYAFPCMAPVSCFTALGAGVIFVCAGRYCHVFPRLAMVSCFAPFGTLSCFPALETGCM